MSKVPRDNSELDGPELLRFDFGLGSTDFGGAGTNYSTLGFNGPPVTSATFDFEDFGSGSHTFNYRVFYTNSTSDPASHRSISAAATSR